MKKIKPKYKNKKVEIDGYKFDSRKEAKRYRELKLLLKVKQISELVLQPEYKIIDTLRIDGHETMRVKKYIADFRYKDSMGRTIVEDVKGFKTTVYNLKKHLFLAKYGNELIFREI